MQLAFQFSSKNIDDDNVTYLQCVLDRRPIAEERTVSGSEQCSVSRIISGTEKRFNAVTHQVALFTNQRIDLDLVTSAPESCSSARTRFANVVLSQ